MVTASTDSPAPSLRSFLKWTMLLLIGVYLLNCLSPLRLHVDTLRYFAIRDCIDLGCPPDSVAAKDYLPYGYTALLLALSKIGLLKSWSIIFINCIYLLGSIYIVKKLFPAAKNAFLFPVLLLLNWTTIKFVTHPLSEMQYLFASVCSLYFFYRFHESKRIIFLFPSFAFGGLAFLTRSVGIALIAALVAGVIWEYRKQLLALFKKNKILIGIVLLALIATVVFSKALGLDHYTGVFNKQFKEGVGLGKMLNWHLTEWAEISFNTSLARVESFLPAKSASIVFPACGIIFLALYIYFIFIRVNTIPVIVKFYLAFYTLLMFNWPFYDPRFWVPVIPLILAGLTNMRLPAGKAGKTILLTAMFLYAVAGIGSIGYMTYTSLNEKVFARKQANGVYRNEYETHFFGAPQSDTARKTDPVILEVLRRYDR